MTATFDNSNPFPGFKQRYDVVCLEVFGNRASMGLVPRNAPPSNMPTNDGLTVQDGGPGGTLDTYRTWNDSPQACAFHLFEPDQFPIQHGNILVHDE